MDVVANMTVGEAPHFEFAIHTPERIIYTNYHPSNLDNMLYTAPAPFQGDPGMVIEPELYHALDQGAYIYFGMKHFNKQPRWYHLFENTLPFHHFALSSGTEETSHEFFNAQRHLQGIATATQHVNTDMHWNTVAVKSRRDTIHPVAFKIARPRNPFILYRQDNHDVTKKQFPKATNNEISVILGRKWRLEPPSVRCYYQLMAAEIKRQLLEVFPQYKYTPRRPGEKKKRAPRKNKAIADQPTTD